MEWQAIETAPKTDNVIIITGWIYEDKEWNSGYQPHDEGLVPRGIKRKRYVALGNMEDLPDGGRRGVGHRNGPVNVTHWMPLPKTPEESWPTL